VLKNPVIDRGFDNNGYAKWWVWPDLNWRQMVPNHLGWTKLPHRPDGVIRLNKSEYKNLLSHNPHPIHLQPFELIMKFPTECQLRLFKALAPTLSKSRIPFKGKSFIAWRIWLVGAQPANEGPAQIGNVPCCIEVGVYLKTAFSAFHNTPDAIIFFNATALRAGQGCLVWRDF
jgi:hypothetical protein